MPAEEGDLERHARAHLESLLAAAVGVEHRRERQDLGSGDPRALARGLHRQLDGAQLGPGGEGFLQERVELRGARRRAGHRRASEPGVRASPATPEQRVEPVAGRLRRARGARGLVLGRARPRPGGAASSGLTSPSRSRTSAIAAILSRTSRDSPGGGRAPRPAGLRRRPRPHVADEIEAALDEALRRRAASDCAAATRRGRCQSASIGQVSVNSSCFGPSGKSSEKIGLRIRPASTRSARASPISASVTSSSAFLHRATATASSSLSPSASETPSGRSGPLPGAGRSAWPVWMRTCSETVPRSCAECTAQPAHRDTRSRTPTSLDTRSASG